MPTKVMKAPKLDREVLKELLLEYLKPKLIARAERMNNTFEYVEGRGYMAVQKPIDLTAIKLKTLKITKNKSTFYRYDVWAQYHQDGHWARFQISTTGLVNYVGHKTVSEKRG